MDSEPCAGCDLPDSAHVIAYCPSCGQELHKDFYQGICPNCESTYIPQFKCHERSVVINWRDLRCLVMWAEFWALSNPEEKYMIQLVHHLAKKLRDQHPEMAALTFREEMQELKTHFPDAEIIGLGEQYNGE